MFPRFPPQGTIKELDLADNAVTDPKIAAHTTTKITVPYSLLTQLALVNADISASAAIAKSKLAADLLTESAEQSSTPVADDTEGTSTLNTRVYVLFTLPTTEKFYRIVGIEWKNGLTVAGDVVCGVDYIDATPPVLATVVSAARARAEVQSGASAVQRASVISSDIIRGGSLLGAWFNVSSASAVMRYLAAQPNVNRTKAVTYTAVTPSADATAWAVSNGIYYSKVYYRGYS